MTWTERLAAGDEVAVSSGRGFSGSLRLARVDRVTATQIVVDGVRYRRSSGHKCGGDAWSHASIVEATTELKSELADRALRSRYLYRINEARWRDISTAVLQRVYEALEPPPAIAAVDPHAASTGNASTRD